MTKLLKDYCNGIQNQIFRLSLESQIDNLFKLNSGKLETLLQRIKKAKTSGNKKELTQEDENDLENYFWSNATEIFKSKKKFTKAEANAFYELISKESKKNENMYFELLVKAICEFKLNNEENLFAIFEQSKNFEGIISLKNEQDESPKLSAFKSVLTFLVKQKLDQKKGFVAVVYCANFEKQINNLKIDSGKKMNQPPLMNIISDIISGVNKFTENNLEPDFKILVENVNSISNEKDLRDFWECFYSKEKKYSGKDKKNKQNEEDNDKLLSALSYVFIDLIDNKKKFQNDFKIENLIKTTKEFVSVLYRLNENENQPKAKSNDKNIKNDIGLINVLNEYYKMYFDRNEQELSGITNQILKHRIARFHTLGNNQKIKLLQYMKNVKNNKPIDYDSNTGFTKTLFSFFKNSSLFEDNSIQSDNLSLIQSQKKGEKKILLQSVIENVDKDVITEPKDKKSFTEAVLFVIKERIEIMKRNYNSNNTTEINKIEDIKAEFENVIIELKNKKIITKDDLVVLNNKMEEACDLWTIVAVLEWFASLLSTMVIVGLCFKAVRRTLCAPIKSRQTRHFIKSAENINDIITKLPLSENNNTGTNLDK